MKVLKSLLCVSLVLFFFALFVVEVRAEEAQSELISINNPPAPTLIAPNETTVTAKVKPLIVGLTKSGSLVKIFIDGIYNGKTEILSHESGTANFAYKPFLNLSVGKHEVYAIAEGVSGEESQRTEILHFNIELPMPAPTMLKPVVNIEASQDRPFIVGLAKNDSKIKIYIDKKYNGEFTVENHSSGVANFAYKPVKALDRGSHLVYAVAIDQRGKESQWSNIVYFTTKSLEIAESVQEEKADTVASIEEPEKPAEVKIEAPIISKDTGTVEVVENDINNSSEINIGSEAKDEAEQAIKKLSRQDEASLEKIKSIIGDASEEKTKTAQGMINEGNLNQAKLKLSVVLFILFLVGVVAWLLWVNRELVKESRAQNEADEKKDNAATNQKDKLL